MNNKIDEQFHIWMALNGGGAVEERKKEKKNPKKNYFLNRSQCLCVAMLFYVNLLNTP